MTQEIDQKTFAEQIAARRSGKPTIVPHIVAGKEYYEGRLMHRCDPSAPSVVVSGCHDAPGELVQEAVAASRKAQIIWDTVPLAERIERIRPALAFVEAAIDEWAVRVALEIGKPFAAARGEGLEIRDIIKFYLEYAARPGAFEDERQPDPTGLANDSVLRPYGVFGVISPFNYPAVQAASPTIAALLAGNGVVIKTSHQGPWSGHAVYEMCQAMKLPEGLVNIIHGEDNPGRALVEAGVDGVCFTGSVAVGTAIIRKMNEGPYPKPVIAEMGGKNPVVVTDTADLELAADGIVFSAFDLSGQKCSALSRVLVTPEAHDRLVELVAERTARVIVADPAFADAFAGPLVDETTVNRFAKIVADAKAEGFSVVGGERVEGEGYLVRPAVVSGVPFDHVLATTEHFAPFLTISKVENFDEALTAANDTTMGLTAGIYTGSKDEARTFLHRVEAGCVNVNVPKHATTGWWPGPQTFGGWKASGSTGKQGLGKWYIQQFARQQTRKLPRDLEELLQF